MCLSRNKCIYLCCIVAVIPMQLLILWPLLQENAARLKAYKAKLVIFPKKNNKPKSGDSSAEDLKNVQQMKGIILPLVHEKPKLETVKLTDELKVDFRERVMHSYQSTC